MKLHKHTLIRRHQMHLAIHLSSFKSQPLSLFFTLTHSYIYIVGETGVPMDNQFREFRHPKYEPITFTDMVTGDLTTTPPTAFDSLVGYIKTPCRNIRCKRRITACCVGAGAWWSTGFYIWCSGAGAGNSWHRGDWHCRLAHEYRLQIRSDWASWDSFWAIIILWAINFT